MPDPGTEITITLEEEVPATEVSAARRLKVSTTLRAPEGGPIETERTAEAVRQLHQKLQEARRALPGHEGEGLHPPRADRPLVDLMEAYNPKSSELVDALLWEGELSPTEHQTLREAVAHRGKATAKAAAAAPAHRTPPPAPATTPPAASSAGADRGKGPQGPPRSVEQLLKELHFKDQKEVNRARYERLISYDEWSALKAHFERKG